MQRLPPAHRPSAVTLRQLRAFVAVARSGSIARAAQQLHLSPSALSMLISGLEGELGVQLFERTTRRLVPTPAATELLPTAEQVFAHLEAAFEGLRQAADSRRERIAIATGPLLAATLLPGCISSFRHSFPNVQISLQDLAVDEVARAVREGQASIGIGTADAEAADLESTVLFQDRLMLACLSDHALARRREVRWGELAGEPLALLRRGSGLRRLAEQGFAQAHETCEPAFEVAQVATAVGLVESGLAVSILPWYALARARPQGVVGVPLAGPVIHRSIVALTARQRRLSPADTAFLAHFKAVMAQMPQDESVAAAGLQKS